MSNYNINSGYGSKWLSALLKRYPNSGKTYFVCKSTSANYDRISDLIKNGVEGEVFLFTTIAAAIEAANARINWTSGSPWGNGDNIFVMPGTYAENLTSMPHGCNLIGIGHDTGDGENGVQIQPATGAAVDVASWVNGYCENIGFNTTDTGIPFDAAICNNVKFKNCRFVGTTGQSAARGFYTLDADRLNIINCEFIDVLIGFEAAYADAGDKFHDSRIQHCKFTNITNKGIYLTTSLLVNGTLISDNYIQCTGASSIGIDDDTDGAIVANNTVIVGTSGTPLDTNGNLSVNNYTMISGGNRAILPAYS